VNNYTILIRNLPFVLKELSMTITMRTSSLIQNWCRRHLGSLTNRIHHRRLTNWRHRSVRVVTWQVNRWCPLVHCVWRRRWVTRTRLIWRRHWRPCYQKSTKT